MDKYIKLTENKGIELTCQMDSEFYDYFTFFIGWSRKTDHAGFKFSCDLLHLTFYISIQDTRHWNTDANRWYLPGEEAAEGDGWGDEE